MEKAVCLVLLLMSSFGLAFGSMSELEKAVPDKVSLLYLELRDKTIYVSWSVVNPSGNVSGYKVSWNDGSQDSDKRTTGTEFVLDYPYNIDCFSNTSISVTPYDENSKSVGISSVRSFIKQGCQNSSSATEVTMTRRSRATWGNKYFLYICVVVVFFWGAAAAIRAIKKKFCNGESSSKFPQRLRGQPNNSNAEVKAAEAITIETETALIGSSI